MQRRDRPRLGKTKPRKLPDVSVPGIVVDFVDGQDDRAAGPHQEPGHVRVLFGRTDGHIHNEQDRIGLLDSPLSLRRDELVESHPADLPAARVNEGEVPTYPFGVQGLAVTGHAGAFLDDGLSSAQYPVYERRLADVRSPDDCHHRSWHDRSWHDRSWHDRSWHDRSWRHSCWRHRSWLRRSGHRERRRNRSCLKRSGRRGRRHVGRGHDGPVSAHFSARSAAGSSARRSEAPSAGTTSTGLGRSPRAMPSRNLPPDRQLSGIR